MPTDTSSHNADSAARARLWRIQSPNVEMLFFFLGMRRPPSPTLFPYTTLFRSRRQGGRDRPQGEHVLRRAPPSGRGRRSEEHTSELQSRLHLVCRLLLEKKNLQDGTDLRE